MRAPNFPLTNHSNAKENLAMSNSNYLEEQILSWLTGTDMPTAPTVLYLAISTAAPTEGGSSIAEPAGAGGYARVAVTFDAIEQGADAATISNDVSLAFGPATADWGDVTHFAVFDAATGGSMLRHAALSAPVTINSGDSATFAVGALIISQG